MVTRLVSASARRFPHADELLQGLGQLLVGVDPEFGRDVLRAQVHAKRSLARAKVRSRLR